MGSRFTEKEIKRAVDMFYGGGMSQREVCEKLGYPSQATLSRWIRDDHRYESYVEGGRGGERRGGHRLKYPYEVRLEAVRLAEEEHMTRQEVADKLGICGAPMVTKWVTTAREKGRDALMTSEEKRKIRQLASEDPPPSDIEELRRQNAQLKMDNAILRETIGVLKKDPSVDPSDLSNREKAEVVDALRHDFPLKDLLARLELPRSSYYYQRGAIAAGDKYAELRVLVAEIFHGVKDSRGYRYVHSELRKREEPVVVSEKVVRRIMSEDRLQVVYSKKKRKYSSYVGEVSEAPENLVGRDFHADAPNELWLTDITEFKIPAGKVYLSPILDCFDGFLPAWSIGPRPTAELANSSLRAACATLAEGEHPVEHSDRGGHYRWPGWIAICDEYGLVRSMSKKGCSPDNSACEGLFGRLKNEFFYYRDWEGVTLDEFMAELDAYLRYYNDERTKESLGWLSPAQYRASLGLAA